MPVPKTVRAFRRSSTRCRSNCHICFGKWSNLHLAAEFHRQSLGTRASWNITHYAFLSVNDCIDVLATEPPGVPPTRRPSHERSHPCATVRCDQRLRVEKRDALPPLFGTPIRPIIGAAELEPAAPVKGAERIMSEQELRYLDLMPALLADLRAIGDVPHMKIHGELHLQYHEAVYLGFARSRRMMRTRRLLPCSQCWPGIRRDGLT